MKVIKATFLLFFISLSFLGSALLWFQNKIPQSQYLTLAQNFLPWFGLLSIFFLLLTMGFRRYKAAIFLLVFPLVSAVMFLPALIPVPSNNNGNAVSMVTANIDIDNKTPDKAVDAVIAQNADLVGIEEIGDSNTQVVHDKLDKTYKYSHDYGSVGLWSKYPIEEGERAEMTTNIGRVLTAMVDLPQGNTQIYVAHMGSYRPTYHTERDQMLAEIAQVMQTDPNQKAILMGDFNASVYDNYMKPVARQWAETQSAQFGMGFTWPAQFPVTKIDHVFYKGYSNGTSTTFDAVGSDHRGVKAYIS